MHSNRRPAYLSDEQRRDRRENEGEYEKDLTDHVSGPFLRSARVRPGFPLIETVTRTLSDAVTATMTSSFGLTGGRGFGGVVPAGLIHLTSSASEPAKRLRST